MSDKIEMEPYALELLKTGECNFIDVVSSNILKVKYNANTQQLFVMFNGGGTYVYDKCPQDEFEKMIKADSKGKYFHKHIKNKYKYKKLE
jgi:hypothetical protein